eukprot:1059394-Alexandrium_andersonii.AAC.1
MGLIQARSQPPPNKRHDMGEGALAGRRLAPPRSAPEPCCKSAFALSVAPPTSPMAWRPWGRRCQLA